MSKDAAHETLLDYRAAIDAVCTGLGEANNALAGRPINFDYFAKFAESERIASRALLKAFEQLQDLISKLIRLILVLEDEDLSGLSARGIAELAEKIGLVGNAARWSNLVRLRNRLVHEYPLTQEQQFNRFHEVWTAQYQLLGMIGVIEDFLRDRDYLGANDD
jgi:uncharacterized protein YutE (UPF0331/DUF86 family)